ncbi:hypothetical protein ACFY2R_29810 [Micromonospora olivasterospora]|uniref:hypothetical protein n=1 Tax=Micromonospora olivasterospora TaxID=1880 RepID=UPI003690CC22
MPGPALGPDHPQGEDLSWLDDWDTLPMPGLAPAPPAGTGLSGLPWLPWPLDDPDAPTASSWPAGPAAPAWPMEEGPAGWTEPGWPVSGSDVTAHGAGMSTDPGQPRNQAGDGGDLGDWATWQGPDMDWQPSLAHSPAVTRTDAGTVHAGDTPHHPADEPPTTPAPLHPDQPQPQPTADSRRVRNRNDARTLFDQHADHIATTTQQREQLRQLWNALIDHMGDDGTITASEPDLAEATSTSQPTVHRRIVALRDSGLLQLVQEAHGRVAARYRVSDPGPPRQAPVPALPAGSQWVRNRNDAQTLFDQHADHIATTTQQRVDQLLKLWNALINHMGADGTITASESDLAAATSTSQSTVHSRIGVLRDSGLLQLVQEARRGVAARYGVSDPGQPRQAPLPDLPEGSQWVRNRNDAQTLFDQHADHIATTTQQREPLRQLWNALINHMGADGTITASERDLAAATSTLRQTVHYRIGALRDSGLLQLVQEAHGRVAARYRVSDPGPPRQAPLPDLPEGSQWVRNRNDARTLFDQHADHIATTTQQREQLPQLWNALINHMGDDGIITASVPALAEATSTSHSTVHSRIGVLRDRGLLQLVRDGHGGVAARYGVSDPGPSRQAPLPDLPEGSQWVRNRNDARTLFDQHADHIATTTQQRVDQLLKLWNALINHMDDDGTITASLSDLAAATFTPQSTVHDRIGVLRGRGLLQLVQEAHRGVAARYGVSDPGQPRQAPVPGPAPGPDRPQGSEDPYRLNHGETSPMPGPAPAPPAGTGLPGLSGPPGPLDAPDAPTASAWPAGPAASAWPMEEGPAGPAGPISGIDVTAHGAAISTDPGQPRIDDQAGDGGNPGDWATWQEDPALDPFDPLHPAAWGGPPTAVGTGLYPGPQPMDPTRPQAPPDPTPWSPPSGDQPSQFPGTQSFPPGPGMQEPAPQSPMPGPAPAPPADTGLPGLPWPLDDPDAPTASAWTAGPPAPAWTAGWTEPGWPDPDIDVTTHGAGMSTDPGQPRNQAGDGSGNLGDWATWQGPDPGVS